MSKVYTQAEQIKQLVEAASKIVIIQADNPDADSLGSALALEQILHQLGIEPSLYCGVDIPSYLRYLSGWDRVDNQLPDSFDLSIIVDASTITLLEQLTKNNLSSRLSKQPCLVLDHHASVSQNIPFATLTLNDDQRSSTGELIYLLAKQLAWPLPLNAQELIMNAILGDTQGLTNSLASSETYRAVADMIDAGVKRSKLEEARRELGKMPEPIFRYKAELIRRSEFYNDGQLALVIVPQTDINQFSALYNPAPLVQADMLATEGVALSVVIKSYDDGRITGAIRCNSSFPIGAELAEHFGGGGHAYAAGFKVQDGRLLSDIKAEVISYAHELLAKLKP